MNKKFIICLAGPTAAGKSQLAIKLAKLINGEVVNADSMQIYKDLPILTSQPNQQDQEKIPHHLYGCLGGNRICSVGQWLEMVQAAVIDIHKRQRLPIIVGGTGLYFKALHEGIAATPDIPDSIKEVAEKKWQEIGGKAFYQELKKLDPTLPTSLKKSDRQRLIRAWTVLQATGKSLFYWQTHHHIIDQDYHFIQILLWPERQQLYNQANQRFQQMVIDGAIEEVKALQQKLYSTHCPVLKAIGVQELSAYLAGAIDLETAVNQAQKATRHYIKRQYTWFRHQPPFAGLDRSWIITSLDEETKIFLEETWAFCRL